MNRYNLQSEYTKNPMRSKSIENYRAYKKGLIVNQVEELPEIENDIKFHEGILFFLSVLGVIGVLISLLILAGWQYAGIF